MPFCTTLPPFWFDLAFSIAESSIDNCVRFDLQIKENWKILFYVFRTEKEEMIPTENKRPLILGSKSYTQLSLKWSRGKCVRFVQSQQALAFELTNQYARKGHQATRGKTHGSKSRLASPLFCGWLGI